MPSSISTHRISDSFLWVPELWFVVSQPISSTIESSVMLGRMLIRNLIAL